MHRDEPTLWTRDFTLVTFATVLGCAGGIVGEFALSFFVFDETGSTLASALIIAIQLVPHVFVPLIISPFMDRLPRKTFLVAGDVVCGIAYAACGLWLMFNEFNYIGYLVVSLAIACLQAVDELAWESIYPNVIPEGAKQKGFAVSSMMWTTLVVILSPFAAFFLDVVGVPLILIGEGVCAVLAAFIESHIHVCEEASNTEPTEASFFSFSTWINDIKETTSYLKDEEGLKAMYAYMAVSNGLATGYEPILIAFFRTAPGMSAAMYALFGVAECAGRMVASVIQYKVKIPKEKRFDFTFLVYQVYDFMDTILLFLPFPFMLANRGICGLLGGNSYVMREAAMQSYIPERMRSRITAFQGAIMMAACSSLALLVGALGEVLDYRWCVAICGVIALAVAWLFVWRKREHVKRIFEAGE